MKCIVLIRLSYEGRTVEIAKALANTDLNLLTVFYVIDEVRHITKASRLLGVSQPALSHSLQRLRVLFDDPLFVKSPRGMLATPRAQALSAPIKHWVRGLSEQVFAAPKFIPEKLERTFVLRTTDLIEGLLLPRLLTTLQAEAPKVRLVTRPTRLSLPQEELEKGSCDLAIAGFFGALPAGYYQQKLFTDSFLVAAAKKHPRLNRKTSLSLSDYCAEKHILIAPGGELHAKADKQLKRLNLSRTVLCGISSFTAAGSLVARTENLLTAPSRLLHQFVEDYSLKLFAVPFSLPPITVVQVWHERSRLDPAHRWFRERVFDVFKKK